MDTAPSARKPGTDVVPDLLRAIVDSGMALIWISGIDGKCFHFNKPWLDFTGRTLAEEQGDGWVEGVHPDDLEHCVGIYTGSFARREKFSMDYRLRRFDGVYRWIQDDGTPYYDGQGQFAGYIGHCLDITDKKHAEERISSLLREKELLLEEVHHRIRNNMTMLMSLLRIQSKNLQNPEASAVLLSAQGRIKSMLVLYDKLFRFKNFSSVSVREYFSTLTDEVVSLFPGFEAVRIEKSIEDIHLDMKILFPLGIILNELLTNSMKYAFTESGAGTLRVAVSRGDSLIRLTVEDSGPGLREKTPEGTSSGFGLTLIRLLAEQVRGCITIDHTAGTKFTLELPFP